MQPSVEQFGYTQELKRVLGVTDLVILGLCMAVPISVSVIYGYVVQAAAGSVAMVYLLAAIGMLLTGNSYARLAEAFPLAGGGYAFVSRGLSRLAGFLIGWAMAGMYIVLLPLLYIFGAYALRAMLPAVPVQVWLLAFIVINTWANYRGLEVTRNILKYILGAELLIYLWTVIACLVAVTQGVEGAAFTPAPFYAPGQFELLAVMAGLSIAVFNFGGPEMLTALGEETRGGARTLGIGVLVAFVALGSLYLLLVYVAALVWPDYTTLGDADTAFYEIVARAGGPALKSAFVVAVVIATFGSCIGAQACSSRLLYAMGRDRMFPKVLSRVHPKYQSPYIGVIAIGVSSTILCLAFPDRAEVMTEMVNFSLLLSWSAVNITTIGYFMLKQRSRNYLRDLACPVLGVLVTGYAFYSLDSAAMKIGLAWLGVGVLFAAWLRYVRRVDLSFASDSGI
ncbi:MAG: APC family permease [Gammaproteobacteria bacterium]|nr:MAG: APC family permease [Gammaproteobacteria bacterium]